MNNCTEQNLQFPTNWPYRFFITPCNLLHRWCTSAHSDKEPTHLRQSNYEDTEDVYNKSNRKHSDDTETDYNPTKIGTQVWKWWGVT